MSRAATRAASLCPALRRAALASGWCLAPSPIEIARLVAALDTLLGEHEEDNKDTPRARPGRDIHLLSLNNGDTRRLTLTLPGQDDPGRGRVSLFSPLGAALLGARAGDIIEARALGWRERACVLSVSPGHGEISP